MRIREIQFKDNSQIESIIKSIFIELQLPLTREIVFVIISLKSRYDLLVQ